MRVLGMLVVLAWLAGCTEQAGVDTDGGVLSDASFRFCNDTDQPVHLTAGERRTYCPLLDEAPAGSCPGLALACEQDGADDTDQGAASGGCSGEANGGGSTSPSAPEAPARPPADLDLAASEMVVEVIRWTVAFGVALVLAVVLFAAGRLLLGWLRGRTPRPEAEVAPVGVSISEVTVPDADALPEAPSADLLAAARQALDEGRAADAVLLCRGAALRALSDAGIVRLHPSKTDREYVRAARRTDEGRHIALRTVLRAVERVRWGGRPLTLDDARAAVEAASRLVPLLLVGLILLTATPSWAAAGADYDPGGSAALLGVFEQHGFDARWRLRTLRSVDEEVDVLVVDVQAISLDDADADALREWVSSGGVLMLAGESPAFPELGTVVRPASTTGLRLAPDAVQLDLQPPALLGGGVDTYTSARGVDWIVASGAAEDSNVLVQRLVLGDGVVIGLADRRYLTNGALVAPANQHFLGDVLFAAEAEGLVMMADVPHLELATIGGASGGGSGPLSALSNARLLPLVLQLLAVLALVGLWRGLAFGPPRDPPDEGRIHFSDHAVALGRRYARAGASRHIAAAHAQLWLRRLGPVALQAAAERHGYQPAAAADLVRRAQAIADQPEGPDRPSDLNLVEELWRITTPDP